jgi:hypothetical protein
MTWGQTDYNRQFCNFFTIKNRLELLHTVDCRAWKKSKAEVVISDTLLKLLARQPFSDVSQLYAKFQQFLFIYMEKH